MWSKLSMCGEVRRKHCGIFLRLCQDEVEQRDPITIEVKVVPRWLSVKKQFSLLMLEMQVQSLVQEDHLESEMATHSSILAWKIPWTEEPGRLQPMTLQRIGHDLAWARWWSLLILTRSFFKIWNASRICVSSLRRGHANLCIIPILVYVLPKWAPWLGLYSLLC